MGSFEEKVLAMIKRTYDADPKSSYGNNLARCLSTYLHREIKLPQVYVSLEKLEQRQLIEAFMVEKTKTRGGRSKRGYRLTPKGIEELKRIAAIFTF